MQQKHAAAAADPARARELELELEANKPAGALDLHDLLEGMSAHLHEHHDVILRWPWKFFCTKWARLLDWTADEEERREKERMDREFAQMRAQHGGGGGGWAPDSVGV